MKLSAAVLLAGAALSGCAVTHKVDLPSAGAPTGTANVVVQDNRLDTTLKMQTIGGPSGGFLLLEATPPVTVALADQVRSQYRGASQLQVALERLELFSKVGFMSPDDMNCGIESTVKTGAGQPALIRTRYRNTENMSPMIKTMARLLISKCLEAHAADIVAAAAN